MTKNPPRATTRKNRPRRLRSNTTRIATPAGGAGGAGAGGADHPRPHSRITRRQSADARNARNLAPAAGNAVENGKGEGGDAEEGEGPAQSRCYWLLKSEPESRMHNGHDVKFSLDDLEASDRPVAWDGIRNVTARNNLRAMTKGDLAFFYHSNCKVPGIVGVAEIVGEGVVDATAHDPESAYHDPKSTPALPKWTMVHIQFRKRFPRIITLKELNTYKHQPQPQPQQQKQEQKQKEEEEEEQEQEEEEEQRSKSVLANMQALRQSRLSVSKVTREEWGFIMGLGEGEGERQQDV